MRFPYLAVALFALGGGTMVRGQEADEVRRLKEKVELLQTQLDAANRKAERLQKENDQLRAGTTAVKAAADGFGAGTKLVGTYSVSFQDANGKKVVGGTDWEVSVTKRSGKEFTAEIWSHKRATGTQVEGTIDDGLVKYKMTKALTPNVPKGEVSNTVFTGRFDNGVFTGTVTTPKLNPTLKGEVKAKVSKD